MKTITMSEMNNAKKTLISRGWEHAYTVMADSTKDGRYGLCFLKGETKETRQEFFLNRETFNKLPE
jgi:hypothetical protein